MKKVDEAQIEMLYAFTRKHFVEWYDVQTELVDHLANGIEEQWKESPNATFDDALKNEFKKFGVFGFMEIVEQKTDALSKYYIKEVLQYLKEFFKLPKIIITLFSVWVVFKLMQLFQNKDYFVIPLVLVVFGYVIFYATKESIRIKKSFKETGKKWLFENICGQMGGLIHLFNIGIYVPLISNSNAEWSLTFLFIFSICIVLYVLLVYISIKIVSPKLRDKLSKEHPEYFLTFIP
jgi:Na+/melibiose symporter-like transporter